MNAKKVMTATGVRWEIRVEVGTATVRQQVTRRFRTEREAKSEIARLQHERLSGPRCKPDKGITLVLLASDWTAASAQSRRPNTVRFYADALRPLLEQYGDLPAHELTSQHLVGIAAGMRSGALRRVGTPGAPMSARSVNAALGAFHGLLEYGVRRGVLAINVADTKLVPRAKDNRTEPDIRRSGWQNEHLAKFRVAVDEEPLEASWLLSAQGLRRGEVLGLEWRDIDWEASTVSVRRARVLVAGKEVLGPPKSKAGIRTMKMGPAVMDALRRQHERIGGEQVTPMGCEQYSDRFTALCAEVHLPQIVLHGVRHAVASAMASAGIPLAAVAKWLGQSQASLAVTLGYTHAQDADGDRIRDVLGG